MKTVLIVLLSVIIIEGNKFYVEDPYIYFEPCVRSVVRARYTYGAHELGEENQYIVELGGKFAIGTYAAVLFDSEANVTLLSGPLISARIITESNKYYFIQYLSNEYIYISVKGVNGVVPYFESLMINGVEHCLIPVSGYLDSIVKDSRLLNQMKSALSNDVCGKRQVGVTELIIDGQPSKAGEWPWHAAIYKYKGANSSYICGGTLISKVFVLTGEETANHIMSRCNSWASLHLKQVHELPNSAEKNYVNLDLPYSNLKKIAHCVTKNRAPLIPDIFSVILGKYNLKGEETTNQQKEVYSIIVHDDFGSPEHMDNDIALLKLMSEAIYNDYVQPACIWFNDIDKKLSAEKIVGKVVGWGITQTDSGAIAQELKETSLPLITDADCIKTNPIFYGTKLKNERKFCAGWRNGTSPCNGDSGSGFMVYVPDSITHVGRSTGSWYIRGITSVTIPHPGTRVCDPLQHVIFTDVLRYENWIRIQTHQNLSR